jgi:raffinose/stachyose/melibiose transport system substrate-binding protein
MKTTIRLFTILLIGTLLLVACGGGGDTVDNEVDNSETENETTVDEPESDEPVTIVVWHQFGGDEEGPWLESKAAFEAAHPNIKIDDTAFAFEDMQAAMTAAFAAEGGPDVAFYDASASFLGILVENGQALDLSDLYAEYGWGEKYFAWSQEKVSYNGKPYGVGGNSEIVGLFYNADLFEELDLQPPDTWDKMITAADKALEADYIPLAQGGLEPWSAGHVMGAFVHSMIHVDEIADVELLEGSRDWNNPEWINIANEIQMFAQDYGYFPEDMIAYSTFDALNDVVAGRALMRIDGSWDVATFDEGSAETGANIRMVQFPIYPESGLDPQAMGGLSSTWIVNAETQQIDAVGTFLDYFVFSDEVNTIWLEIGFLPSVDFDTSSVETSVLTKDALAAIAWADTGNGLGHWVGFSAAPAYADAFGANLQALLSDNITPEEFASKVSEKMAEVRE